MPNIFDPGIIDRWMGMDPHNSSTWALPGGANSTARLSGQRGHQQAAVSGRAEHNGSGRVVQSAQDANKLASSDGHRHRASWLASGSLATHEHTATRLRTTGQHSLWLRLSLPQGFAMYYICGWMCVVLFFLLLLYRMYHVPKASLRRARTRKGTPFGSFSRLPL